MNIQQAGCRHQKENGIVLVKKSGDKSSADHHAAKKFIGKFSKVIADAAFFLQKYTDYSLYRNYGSQRQNNWDVFKAADTQKCKPAVLGKTCILCVHPTSNNGYQRHLWEGT